jgi:hypothetical protein
MIVFQISIKIFLERLKLPGRYSKPPKLYRGTSMSKQKKAGDPLIQRIIVGSIFTAFYTTVCGAIGLQIKGGPIPGFTVDLCPAALVTLTSISAESNVLILSLYCPGPRLGIPNHQSRHRRGLKPRPTKSPRDRIICSPVNPYD